MAALGVAFVILVAAWRLTRESVNALLDRAPSGARGEVERRVRSVPGVAGRPEVRVRPQGPVLHVDAVVRMDGHNTLEQAHGLASAVEDEVRKSFPGADVNVHVEPEKQS